MPTTKNETKYTPCFASLLDAYGLSMYEEGKYRGRDEGSARKREVLLSIHAEMLEALRDTLERIEHCDAWWIDCPNRGGIDADKIHTAIAKAEGR